MAQVTVCYAILLALFVQAFAIVNQRRYRSAFWLAIAALIMSCGLAYDVFYRENTKAMYFNTGEDAGQLTDDQRRAVWQ